MEIYNPMTTQIPELEIIRASEIVPREVEWLWYPYIPYGKITLVQGDPGDGKSTFVLNLAALLTSGKPLPFCDEEREPVNVIYQNTEDDADDTVIPRFIQAGGNPEHLCFINEKQNALTFSDERIVKAIKQLNARLVILDPLSSYIGKDVSLNLANDVRSQFNPLIEAAKETRCAIVIVCHMNKMSGTKAIYRTTGSIDVVGAARSALLIARTEPKGSERIMAVQKSNLAPTGKAIIFSVGEDGVSWLEETEKTADEVLGNVFFGSGRHDTKKQQAIETLRLLLADGAKPTLELKEKMKAAGISGRTAETAKAELGVQAVRQGCVWYWRLP